MMLMVDIKKGNRLERLHMGHKICMGLIPLPPQAKASGWNASMASAAKPPKDAPKTHIRSRSMRPSRLSLFTASIRSMSMRFVHLGVPYLVSRSVQEEKLRKQCTFDQALCVI